MKISGSTRAIASKLSPAAQYASGYANNEAAILGLDSRLKLTEKSPFLPFPVATDIQVVDNDTPDGWYWVNNPLSNGNLAGKQDYLIHVVNQSPAYFLPPILGQKMSLGEDLWAYDGYKWYNQTQAVRQLTPREPVFNGIAPAPPFEDYPLSISLEPGTTKNVIVYGRNFLSAYQVYLIPAGKSNLDLAIPLTAQIIDSNRFLVTISTATEGIFDLVFVLTTEIQLRAAAAVEVKTSVWIDFRQDGTAIAESDWRKRTDISINRSTQGMQITGDTGWDVGLGYLPLSHPRSDKKTYQFVGKFVGSIMLGVVSADFNINQTTMYSMAEIAFWLRNANTFARFYGNGGSFSVELPLDGSKFHRLTLENNGEPGANYFIHELPSGNPEDWDDSSNLVAFGQTPNIFSHANNTLCPGFIPSSLGAIYTAVKVSN